jgi:hypothetical protein
MSDPDNINLGGYTTAEQLQPIANVMSTIFRGKNMGTLAQHDSLGCIHGILSSQGIYLTTILFDKLDATFTASEIHYGMIGLWMNLGTKNEMKCGKPNDIQQCSLVFKGR